MWFNLQDLASHLGQPADANLMRQLTPQLKCVYVTREDTDAQAVSFFKAMQNGAWESGHPKLPDSACVYDFGLIEHLRGELTQHNRAWTQWFAANGITPHRVTYDQLVADRQATVDGVLRFIGVEGAQTLPPPRLQRQADQLSAAWLARFRKERAARGLADDSEHA